MLVQRHLEYCSSVLRSSPDWLKEDIEAVQKQAARFVTGRLINACVLMRCFGNSMGVSRGNATFFSRNIAEEI